MRAQEALAQFEVLVLSLTDAEFQAVGPVEGDWSAAQIVDHVIERERSQRAAILAGLAKETAPFSESAPDGDE
jgi:hypothetical protein